MSKNLFGISTLIMSIAFLIWSIGETFAYPQGPNVSLGSNPIVTLDCGGSQTSSSDIGGYPSYSNPYQVPSGYDFIITDIGAASSDSITIRINDGSSFKMFYRHLQPSYGGNGNSQINTMNTGILVPSNYVVRCDSSDPNGLGFLSGYLAHQ